MVVQEQKSPTRTAQPYDAAAVAKTEWIRVGGYLGLLLGIFLIIENLLPLGTVLQVGADEGFELAKVTLVLQGNRLYSEVWNDQPPFHTWLDLLILKVLPNSVL